MKLNVFLLSLSLSAFSLSSTVQANNLTHFQSLYKASSYQALVQEISQVKRENWDFPHYRLYINALLNLDLDDAEEAAENAIAQHEEDPRLYLLHASVMGAQAQDSIFSALGYAEKALSSLETAVQLAPEDPQYRSALMGFHLAAPSIAGGDVNEALKQAQKIAELDKVKGIIALSHYQFGTDESEKAFTLLNEGIIQFPDHGALYHHQARLFSQDDRPVEAITSYSKVTEIGIEPVAELDTLTEAARDEYESATYRLLESHYQIGRLALINDIETQKGIQHLTHYIDMLTETDLVTEGLPSLDWANLRLAALRLNNGQTAQARTHFELVKLNDQDSKMKSVYKKLAKALKS